MKIRFGRLAQYGACLVLTAVVPATVAAQAVADFYKDKQMQLVVGTDAGGGFDTYGRLLTRHIGRHIPGQPSFIVMNMPGAGSLKAANYVYGIAKQDGTVLMTVNRTAPFVQILGQPGPTFEATKFHWIGSLMNEGGVVRIWHTVPVKTIADARKQQVILGSTAAGTDTEIFPLLMNATLGTQFKIVRGYQTGPAVDLAIERGEIHGQADSFTSMVTRHPNWLQTFTVLTQLSSKPQPALANVPMIMNLLTPENLAPGVIADEARAMWELMLALKVMGRPFAMGPGVPVERVASLRQAFRATVADPEFRADAAKSKMEIDPVDGDELQALMAKAAATSKPVIAKLNDSIKDKGEATDVRKR